MKKLIILISVIITFFVFFLFMYLLPRNYEKKYEIKKVEITEKYNKEKDCYYFNFKYNKKNFEYVSTKKYTTKRTLVKDLKIIKEGNSVCIIPESDYITFYPLSDKDNRQVSYELVDIAYKNEKIKKDDITFNGLNIDYLNDKTFLIWNYKGFNYINDSIKKEINFLKEDNYNLELVAKVNNYVLVPDYDSDHTFNKIYIINLKNGKLDEWNLKEEIYFDSYIVGIENKSVYLFDKKTKIEYELRPDKKKIREIKYKAIINDEWQNISLGDLNKKITFSKNNVYNYSINNNKLYLNYLNGKNKILLSNNEVTDIVYKDNDTVYYLSHDKLYMYNNLYGEVQMMDYFEWNFNYKDMIYIY